MNQYLIALITGLTTGGLSCLAVQGGLLASSLESQIGQDVINRPVPQGKKRLRIANRGKTRLALPILFFLISKIFAYTLLGFFLGAIGSALKLNSTTRAVLLILIGIFMVGNGLRMLNIHPIFRYFVIEPPKSITRYIRRKSKGNDIFTPLFLGALTVLIPCGVTQAMMAVAIGSGDPWQAAGLMFSFTLGTSPIFFIISYLATELGSRMESVFLRLVAVVVLVLGLVSVDSGFTLAGAPSIMSWLGTGISQQQILPGESATAENNVLLLNATNDGYSPRVLHAKANLPIQLNMITKETYSCARGFVIPSINIEKLLPANGTVVIDIPSQESGTVMKFTCSMGMYTGEIHFDLK
ncbi:MAG: sulfite exporter TauE/SafE family protein [Chloroflexi bacterium]|nr:sulfite exporter TauE/SafE family protein [Chloroflexota bacterium]